MSRRKRPRKLADLPQEATPADAITQPHILAHLLGHIKDPNLVHALVTRFATWDDFTQADSSDVLVTAGNAALQAREIPPPHLDLPVATETTTRYEHTYPQQLLTSPTPPVLLYSTGQLIQKRTLAIIGSLHSTNQAATLAKSAAASAVVRDIPVVAVLDDTGIGTTALETVCELGGLPIAVISGDVSSSHLRSELATRVKDSGGLCISDTHPQTRWSQVHAMVANHLAVSYAHAVVACDPGLHPAGGAVGVRTAIALSRPLIVPRTPNMVKTESFGTNILTDPSLFTPEMFGTNPTITARLAYGQPAADQVPTSPTEMDEAIATYFSN